MKKLSATIITLIALTLAAMAASETQTQPAVGQAAPEFSLPTSDGSQVSLKDFKGKWVVLYFYPKDMTQGCTIEAHGFQNDLTKYDADNAVILGVSVDSVDSHKQFCAKDSLTFKLLSDTEKKTTEAYGSLSERGMAPRNTFLIAPNGKIVKVWTAVKPQHHSEEVLAA